MLRLLAVLPVRSSELAAMQWSQIDWESAQWKYTVGKTQRAFVMPLPHQAVKLLEGLKAQANGSEWVFPSGLKRGGHVHPNFVRLTLVEKLGYEVGKVTCHGFRSTHRTLGQEALDIDPVILELNLGHLMPGVMGETYARAKMLPQRTEAMQKWADYLDELRMKATAQGGE
ncbi:Prophage integrase IntA [compost metagenome]